LYSNERLSLGVKRNEITVKYRMLLFSFQKEKTRLNHVQKCIENDDEIDLYGTGK
jgi:hypothetical protein